MGRYRVQQKLKCKQGTEGEHSFGWVYHKRPRCIVLREDDKFRWKLDQARGGWGEQNEPGRASAEGTWPV